MRSCSWSTRRSRIEKHIKISDKAKQFVLDIKHAKTLDDCAMELKKYPGPDKGRAGVYPFESLKQMQG
jgi:hypothetical protein